MLTKSNRKYIGIVSVLFTLLLCSFTCACSNNSSNSVKENNTKTAEFDGSTETNEEQRTTGQITEATVTKIVDGDTIYVDAYKTRIRLIGVDCPEIETTAGKEAKAFTANLIPVGTKVGLEKDVSEADKYGRPLRYVGLEKPSSKVTEFDVRNKTLNCCLLYRKQATDKQYPPDTKYADGFHTTVINFAF